MRPMPEGFDPPESSAKEVTGEALRGALRRLPERYRTAIYLHYYEGLSTEEIARILGEKPTTIRTRLRRGREKLKTMLEEEEER